METGPEKAKRPVGRPRKDPTAPAVPKEPVAAKRPVGRPRKDPTAPAVPKEPVAAKRPVGRPRKDPTAPAVPKKPSAAKKPLPGHGGHSQPFTKIATYGDLTSYLLAFAEGHINLLVLSGGPGLGKSQLLHKLVNGDACWIEGNVTAFELYSKLYEAKDRKVIIDDVDSIYADRNSVSLLKSVCQSDAVKKVSWNAGARYLDRFGLPSSFETTSRLAIVTNDWRSLNRNVTALEDRAEMIRFEPTAAEVHQQAGAWFKDDEVYEWFGKNLDRVVMPTFRNYTKASARKAAGLPWKTLLGGRTSEMREELVKELVDDSSFNDHEARAREFSSRGGGSRGTYYNYRKKLGL